MIDAERIKDALWPGWELKDHPPGKRRPADSTLNTTTTVARDCLGPRAGGELRLPPLQGNGTRRYRLEDVWLDYQLFLDAAAWAQTAERDGDPGRGPLGAAPGADAGAGSAPGGRAR